MSHNQFGVLPNRYIQVIQPVTLYPETTFTEPIYDQQGYEQYYLTNELLGIIDFSETDDLNMA